MARPKGYAEWQPNATTLDTLANVQAILTEYREHLPLTCRQIFYRLVGNYGFEKTEKAYKRLCEYLVRARRAELVPFAAIRDDGTDAYGGGGYNGPAQFWRGVRQSADYYERNRMERQDHRVELWCEAAGMAPQLARAVDEWSIPVYSTGGFSSVTVTHEIAERIARKYRAEERPTVFMHVGDFDPSGESIFESMAADIEAFLDTGHGFYIEDVFEPVRVALTREQVTEFDLPTAPPKSTDTRSRNWIGQTTQAEAMPPDLLNRVVRDAISARLDHDVLQEVLDKETEDREAILEVLEGLDADETDA